MDATLPSRSRLPSGSDAEDPRGSAQCQASAAKRGVDGDAQGWKASGHKAVTAERNVDLAIPPVIPPAHSASAAHTPSVGGVHVDPSPAYSLSTPLSPLTPDPDSPLSSLPLDPLLLRECLLSQLESAKAENHSLYIDSARRMIELQQQIDDLTRENVRLIRALTPPQPLQW